jgi:hypothetical protein
MAERVALLSQPIAYAEVKEVDRGANVFAAPRVASNGIAQAIVKEV